MDLDLANLTGDLRTYAGDESNEIKYGIDEIIERRVNILRRI